LPAEDCATLTHSHVRERNADQPSRSWARKRELGMVASEIAGPAGQVQHGERQRDRRDR
jgi:hypothetical protein